MLTGSIPGQRYHVIVEAKPNSPSQDGNYWIRTVPALGCNTFNKSQPLDNRTGIVRYDPFNTDCPTTQRNTFDYNCSDETYTSLKPIVEWDVADPKGEYPWGLKQITPTHKANTLQIRAMGLLLPICIQSTLLHTSLMISDQ